MVYIHCNINSSFQGNVCRSNDTIFENYPTAKFTRRELEKLFKIATSETQFIFNNEIQNQTDSVSMGYSLPPILANLFIGYHEKDQIEKTQVVKLTFY